MTARSSASEDRLEFGDTKVKRAWIDREITIADLEVEDRVRRTQKIIAFSETQLDRTNRWLIDGVKGSGLMPEAYYNQTLMELMKVPEQLTAIKARYKEGDKVLHFASSLSDEGYILVRDNRILFEWWLAVN